MARAAKKPTGKRTSRNPPVKKRSSPTKVSRAVANTKPMTFYFSASPSPSSSPSNSSCSKSGGKLSSAGTGTMTRHRLTALSPNVLDRTNRNVGSSSSKTKDAMSKSKTATRQPPLTLTTPSNKRRGVNTETSKDSPQQQQPSIAKKRKTTNTERPSDPKVKKGTDSNIGTGSSQKTSAWQGSSEIRSKTIPVKGEGNKSNGCKQVPSALFPDQRSPNAGIQNATKADQNDNDIQYPKAKPLVDVKLGLIRVEKSESSLLESCLILNDPSLKKTRTIYPLCAGTILGRNEKKPKPNKTLIDIPSCENGISRKQLEVIRIHPPKDVNVDPGTITAESRTGRLSNYLHKSQRCGPTMEIMCSKNAVNAVQVVRARAMDLQTITPLKRISHPTQFLGKGERCSLNVGDVIVFDPFWKKSGDTNPQRRKPEHQFMVVSFDVDEQLTAGEKGPCIDLTTETSEVIPATSEIKRIAAELSSSKDAQSKDGSEVLPRQKSTRIVKRDVSNESDSIFVNIQPKEEPARIHNESLQEVMNSEVTESEPMRIAKENDVVVKIVQAGIICQSRTASLNTKAICATRALDSCVAPNVGDMFCVLLSYKDLFTKQKSKKRFIGKVTNVKNATGKSKDYQLTICYNDKSLTEERYPRKGIQQIYRRPDSSIYETKSHDIKYFAYDTNPGILAVGDYVECYYQNGLHGDLWYYGRIAAVSSDGKNVDVAYFGGTYEEGVPIGSNHIHLIERGSFQASKWLSNAMLTDPLSSASRKSKVLKVYCKNADVDPDKLSDKDCSSDLVCVMKCAHSRQEEKPYQSIIKLLFSQYRDCCARDDKIVSWPTNASHLSLKEDSPDLLVSEMKYEANNNKTYSEAPNVGDFIRVTYNEERGIFTGLKEESSCVATVLSIKKQQGKGKKNLITIRYNDHKIEEVEYPNSDMEKIVRRGNRRSSTFETASGTTPGAFAYDENPRDLVIGDFVECLYQNGLSNGMWFTGRVGNVSSDGATIDVAYFDDEYETNIPLQKGFVHLLSRGSRLPNKWLAGAEYTEMNQERFKVLKVCSQSEFSILECTSGIDYSNDLYCLVRASNGDEKEVPYTDVLAALFLQARGEKSLKVWPSANIERPLVPALSGVSPKITNPFTSFIASSDCDGEDLNMSQDSHLSFSFGDDEEVNGPKVANLKPALANACWRAFESSEPCNAYGMLTHMEASMKLVPNHQLTSFLSDFLGLGPQFEGIQIQDPFRTELIIKYCQRITSATHGNDSIKTVFSICPSNFDKLSDLLSLPTNAEEGPSIESMSASYLRRLSRSLQHCARTLTFVSTSFEMETKDVIDGIVEQVDSSALSRMPFTSLFLENERSQGNHIRSSLKIVVQKAIKCLLQHGHWLIGHPHHTGRDGRKLVDEQRCAVETKACTKALCQIVSRVAWLYCAKEESSFPHNDCCFTIRDAMESEFSAFDYSLISRNGKQVSSKVRNEYKRDVTLHFLLFLQSDFSMSTELQSRLSELLEVSSNLSVLRD